MLVRDVLVSKDRRVIAIDIDAPVSEAIAKLVQNNIGSLPVLDPRGHLVGIFSERDVVRRVVAMGRPIDKTRLAEVMTPDPITASPGDERAEAMRKMDDAQCRHLPIVQHGALVDMLSIRDVLFVELEERAEAVESLRRYIGGSY